MTNKEIPTMEELMVYMNKVNDRLDSVYAKQDEIRDELAEIFEDFGNTLRPLIRDYYGLGEE